MSAFMANLVRLDCCGADQDRTAADSAVTSRLRVAPHSGVPLDNSVTSHNGIISHHS